MGKGILTVKGAPHTRCEEQEIQLTVTRRAVFYAAPLMALCLTICAGAQTPAAQNSKAIPAGAKVYIAPMDGFETFLKAALEEKKVPLVVVEDKDKADLEITGASNSEKAGTAKKILTLRWHSKEEASINVANIRTGEIVFAYSAHKANSAHGKQSSAEAYAKHLKEKVPSRRYVFEAWTRAMTVSSAGNVSIEATLERIP